MFTPFSERAVAPVGPGPLEALSGGVESIGASASDILGSARAALTDGQRVLNRRLQANAEVALDYARDHPVRVAAITGLAVFMVALLACRK